MWLTLVGANQSSVAHPYKKVGATKLEGIKSFLSKCRVMGKSVREACESSAKKCAAMAFAFGHPGKITGKHFGGSGKLYTHELRTGDPMDVYKKVKAAVRELDDAAVHELNEAMASSELGTQQGGLSKAVVSR